MPDKVVGMISAHVGEKRYGVKKWICAASNPQEAIMKTFLAACVAPCASPLLTAGYAWVMLHVGAQADELGRWCQFVDLWSLFLGEFAVALVIMWCIGFPGFVVTKSRNALSGFGMCIAGALTGALLSFLAATIVSLPEFSFGLVLIAVVVGGMKGVAVAGAFYRWGRCLELGAIRTITSTICKGMRNALFMAIFHLGSSSGVLAASRFGIYR